MPTILLSVAPRFLDLPTALFKHVQPCYFVLVMFLLRLSMSLLRLSNLFFESHLKIGQEKYVFYQNILTNFILRQLLVRQYAYSYSYRHIVLSLSNLDGN